jgi:hypothetical protein
MRVEVTLIRRPPTQAPLLAGGLLRRQLDPPVRAENERLMRRSLTAARNIEGTVSLWPRCLTLDEPVA